MKIAVVGCGFVFDIYMRTFRAHPELELVGVFDLKAERMAAVSGHYGLRAYDSYEQLLGDPEVEAVVNLTTIGSHFEVSRRALDAGKHVYSEKPLTTSVDESRQLFELAAARGVRLYGAPCNIFSDSVRTIFQAVEQGAIGKPLLVYAELDDNPIHLMGFDKVVSPTGAPWPLREEILEGCTYEHLGYHLVWICGLLGPAVSVTAFSSELIEDKMAGLPARVGTPDFSVANLQFANGAVARITCSVVAPRDHRMRVIGRAGEISTDSYRQYRAPVFLERFSAGSLNARKFQSLRARPSLGRRFGIGGRRLRLARNWKSGAVERNLLVRPSLKERIVGALRRREVYAQDKFAGIAEMAREIRDGQAQYLSPDFLMHINELTLLVQGAGPDGVATKPATTFTPLGPIPGTHGGGAPYGGAPKPLERLIRHQG
ncbi:Gfo/Idh/MocA family protein [Nocardioides sp. Kera G14]|uniref:Gfo/Idh/MocA family protein n=1 Tax=Nocardioides sp. Kera G14 TaxID=2884264 RepID=UPI001D0F4E91|nr:Gfo/Idh/MocA family oxidoreductase [Nocardioides sp. Kera G14]UDY23118.1 Gfo/Idh/MocA family oxidoreductase [Nocardioides sp. Kera G14]